MRILIVTWYYPPWNEVASNRPQSWAKHFAEQGHPTTVLTCRKDPRLHADLSTPVERHPNLEVIETPLRLLRTPVAKGASWAAGSLWRAARLIRQHDAIISTFMPWHVHALAGFARFANRRALWCADYRDLWQGYDFYMEGRPLKKAVVAGFEKWVMRSADLTTTVSPPLAASLARTHPHIPSFTIYNGFPEAEYRGTKQPARLEPDAAPGKPFEIVYTGTLYEGGYHDPEPLCRVLARTAWRRPVKLYFHGQSAHSTLVKTLRERYRLEDTIELPPRPLSRSDCVRRQQEADLLLHLGWTNREMDGVLSGKIFEYLASGTPILSVGADPDTAIGQLLARTGAGYCAAKDEAAIEQVLQEMVNRGRTGEWYAPRKEEILVYSRERQAQRLLELLEERLAVKTARG